MDVGSISCPLPRGLQQLRIAGFNEAMLYGKTSKDAPATLLKEKKSRREGQAQRLQEKRDKRNSDMMSY